MQYQSMKMSSMNSCEIVVIENNKVASAHTATLGNSFFIDYSSVNVRNEILLMKKFIGAHSLLLDKLCSHKCPLHSLLLYDESSLRTEHFQYQQILIKRGRKRNRSLFNK
jgi:hypothetical protein